MAAKIVFNSCDLLRYIYSFGDPEHRKAMHKLVGQIQYTPYDFKYEFADHKSRMRPEDRDAYSIYMYLDQVPRERLLKLLSEYKRCYCCKRHNTQKPMFHHGQLMTFRGVVTDVRPGPKCRCVCRHYSRIIILTLFT